MVNVTMTTNVMETLQRIFNKYRIMSVVNAETGIIASITASPIRQAVIIYVETFKTGVNVFICKRHNVFHVTLNDSFSN